MDAPRTLASFLDSLSPDDRREFASRCGTNMAYLNQIRCGVKRPSPELAQLLHDHSDGAIDPVALLGLRLRRPDPAPAESVDLAIATPPADGTQRTEVVSHNQ